MAEAGQVIELGFTMRLLDDFKKSCEGMTGPDAQFWRRNAVRSLFGFLEAWMSVNRNHMIPDVLRSHARDIVKTDEDRVYIDSLLNATDPQEWSLNEKGEGEAHKRKLRFLPYLKANFRMVLFISGVAKEEVNQFFVSANWGRICLAAKVRDRLMHPHVHEDVFVTDEEVTCILGVTDLMCAMWNKCKIPNGLAVYSD